MWASLRSTVSSVPSPEFRSGCADRKKISAISASGGAKRETAERTDGMVAPPPCGTRPLGSTGGMLSITTKSPYALQALVELARSGGPTPVPIGELARRRDIPVQFLEQLFAVLRRAGLLKSQRGVKGGYTFAREPADDHGPRGRRAARRTGRRRGQVDLRRGRGRRPRRARQRHRRGHRRAREPRGGRVDVLHLDPRLVPGRLERYVAVLLCRRCAPSVRSSAAGGRLESPSTAGDGLKRTSRLVRALGPPARRPRRRRRPARG